MGAIFTNIAEIFAKSGWAQIFFTEGGWKYAVMLAVACVLLYLAIVKQFEPLLLLPIGFGMLMTNLPLDGIFHMDIFINETNHIDWALLGSSGGMVDGLSLKASEALIDASSGGGIRNVAVTAPKAGVEISSGAVVKGVSLDAAALTCQASSGAVATLEHTGNNSMLNTSSGGVIRITGSTRILTVNKSRSGGNINTDGYTVSYRVQ